MNEAAERGKQQVDVAIDSGSSNRDYTCVSYTTVYDDIVFVLGTHWLPAETRDSGAKEGTRKL